MSTNYAEQRSDTFLIELLSRRWVLTVSKYGRSYHLGKTGHSLNLACSLDWLGTVCKTCFCQHSSVMISDVFLSSDSCVRVGAE